VVISAASDNVAYESPALEGSVLTYCLLATVNAVRRSPLKNEVKTASRVGDHGGVIVQSWYESSRNLSERLLDLGLGLARQDPQLFGENDAFELIPLQEP